MTGLTNVDEIIDKRLLALFGHVVCLNTNTPVLRNRVSPKKYPGANIFYPGGYFCAK